MKHRNVKLAAAVSAMLMMSGCAQDISKTLPPEVTAVEALATQSTDDTTTTTTTVTTTSATTTTTAETTTESVSEVSEDIPADTSDAAGDTTTAAEQVTYPMYSDEYKQYIFSDEYNDFISKCVFVGDSICSGLKAYDILPADRVAAVGNVAARNIFEDWVEFKINGSSMSLIPALVDLAPEYIVFSMGMNDVNITSEQTFCNNYENILSQVESFLPDATLIVCSVTPVTYGESGKLFTSNDNIDSFNHALKEYLDSTGKWIYADIEHDLKNTHNMLKDDYLGSPDGVHLAPDAYYAILYQICERMVDGKVYNFDGTFSTVGGENNDRSTETSDDTERSAEIDEDSLSGTLNLSDSD